MPTLFIHGVSNRDEARFNTHVTDIVRPRLAAALEASGRSPEPADRVRGVYWGAHGAALALGGESVPAGGRLRAGSIGAATAGAPASPDDLRYAVQVLDITAPGWRFDAPDPAPGSSAAPATPRGSAAPNREAILDRLSLLLTTEQSLAALDRLALAPQSLLTAVHDYLAAPGVSESLAAGNTEVLAALPDIVLVRLTAARAASGAAAIDPLITDLEARAQLRALLAEAADSGEPRAVARGVGQLFRHPVLSLASAALRQVRLDIMRLATMSLGDVMVYLAAGDTIRETLADALAQLRADFPNEPIRLIAHSLGGIVSYDYLSVVAEPDEVDLFITVGSQVSLFAEYGTLLAQRQGQSTPFPMPRPRGARRWLNLYDLDDFLSFTLQGAFDLTDSTITEKAVDTDEPFPMAHSAYFVADSFYEAVAAAF